MSYRDWIVSKLNESEEYQEIDSATALGNSLIEIRTDIGKIVIAGAIDSSATITNNDVYKVYTSGPKLPNVVVAKFESIWSGSAIDYSRRQNMGWGGIGEIYNAFHTDHYKDIQKREYKFVEDGLSKHSRVTHLERIYDRVFKIYRNTGLPPIILTLINSYELSGEEVRHAAATYGNFDAILKTNPNGNPTGNAYSAAGEIGAEIFVWRELFARLNKK